MLTSASLFIKNVSAKDSETDTLLFTVTGGVSERDRVGKEG